MQNALFAAGERRGRAAARRRAARSASATSTCAALNLIISVNQNVPTLRRRRHQQRLPAESRPTRTTASTRPRPTSNYHGLHVSFVQRPARWGNYRVSYTLSKSMNNVGEIFFSSPIDPFDLSKDWGRSDDDQRHRLVVTGSVNSLDGRRRSTAWERLSHGFQVSGMLQYVLGAAVQHHVRRDDHPGHRRPADRRRRVHPAQRRHRRRFLHAEPARQPLVSARPAASRRRPRRSVQPHESAQRSDAQRQLRRRRVSDESGCRRSTRSRPSAIREPSSSACG